MKFCVKPLPILATIGLKSGIIATSHSQTTVPVQKLDPIKLGAFFLTQSNRRDLEVSTAFSAGVDYAFVKINTVSLTLPLITSTTPAAANTVIVSLSAASAAGSSKPTYHSIGSNKGTNPSGSGL